MVVCGICGNTYKNCNSLSKHVTRTHKMSTQDYYDKYILFGEFPKCEICGKRIFKFHNLSKGYSSCCCRKCAIEKSKRTCLIKYGVENVFSLKGVQQKIKQTNIENLGVEYPTQSPEIKEKVKKTNIEKFGVECNLQLESTKKQIKKTCLDKYGTEYANQSEQVKKKIKQTNRKKYGADYALSSKDVQDKRKNTNIKKYGVENAASSQRVKDKIKKILTDKFIHKMLEGDRLKHCAIINEDDYVNSKTRNLYKFKCNYCGEIFTSNVCNGSQPTCPHCFPKVCSGIEQNICDTLTKYNISFEQQVRHIIPPYELDVYVSLNKVAIETHGLYWHSEQQLLHKRGNYLPKKYHLIKFELCKEKDIILLQFFEDEIVYKYDIVKSIILNKFNKSKVICGARQCKVSYIDNKMSNIFLDSNHLHGRNYGKKINIGAFFNDKLVGVMSFKQGNLSRRSKEWELDRFCCINGCVVVGLASKLFKKFMNDYNNIKKIITYADLRFVSGAIYGVLGFDLVKQTVPNYYYCIGGKRKHRFSYRKSVLKDKLKVFDPNLTEYQNMLNNGYDRVWDCGHLKYQLNR